MTADPGDVPAERRSYGTPFQESEALLALTAGDEDTAEAILRDMLPGELYALRVAARELIDMARSLTAIKMREASR